MIWVCTEKDYYSGGDYVWKISFLTDEEDTARQWYNQNPRERDIESWPIV